MLIIGVTGGIGAGKSEVCRVFKKLRAKVISGDEIGREVVEKNPALLKKLIKTFGEEIINSDKTLNRRKLGKKAFASSQAKTKLNKIVHPYLLSDLRKKLKEHRGKNSPDIVVVDAALIVEWGLEKELDFLVYVHSKRADRIKRLIDNQDYSYQEASNRIKSQLPEREKKRRADYIIRNDSDLKHLHQRTKRLWDNMLSFKEHPTIKGKKIDKKN